MCSLSPWNYELWPQDQLNFQVPNSYHPDELSYLTEYVLIPHAEGTSHMPIMMVNVSVAPEGKMLRSELEAALYIARAQHANGRFTDHKIKPVSLPFADACSPRSEDSLTSRLVHRS